MPIEIHDTDYKKATAALMAAWHQAETAVVAAIAAERERCASIAEAIDSGRGNEKLIADAIRRPESWPPGDGKPKRHTVSGSDAAEDDDL